LNSYSAASEALWISH